MKNIEFIEEQRRNHRMQLFIAINGPDDEPVDESVRLSRICPIGNGASGCVHVTRVKRCVISIHPFDLHRAVSINRKVH